MVFSLFKNFFTNTENPKIFPLRPYNDGNFVFIHINKTGGTSISKVVGLPRKRHLTVKEVIAIVGQKHWDNAIKFTVVRNPWDKVVSHYKYRLKRDKSNLKSDNISFSDWVRWTYGEEKKPFYYNNPKMFLPQADWLKDNKGVIQLDYILRFENLNSDFKRFAKIIGIHDDLPHLNKTRATNYQDFYDEQTRVIVANWFQEDIELFDYKF